MKKLLPLLFLCFLGCAHYSADRTFYLQEINKIDLDLQAGALNDQDFKIAVLRRENLKAAYLQSFEEEQTHRARMRAIAAGLQSAGNATSDAWSAKMQNEQQEEFYRRQMQMKFYEQNQENFRQFQLRNELDGIKQAIENK